jgi:acyl-coenzyme A synthetase/AMP-(fatty) acid ligase
MNTHRAIVNRLLWMQEAYGLTPGDAVLQKTPASFDVSVWEFFWPLMTGARLVLARPGGHRDPEYLARCIQDHGVTTVHFVPTLLRAFLDHPAAARCRGLRCILCSGEALPCDLKTRCLDLLPAELHNLYGPTEAAVDVTAWALTPDPEGGQGGEGLIPIGRPIHNTAIHILDPWLSPAPIGVPGELCIGGVGLARGYLHRPDLTAERFIPDPFGEAGARLYRTGDRARRRSDGAIEYLGRLDHQVKIRGVRIEPGEVEAALRRHPGVREAVVIACEGRLIAYVVGNGGPACDLTCFCRSQLPEAYVPARFVLLDRLPLTPSGKIDRRALPAPGDDRPETAQPYAAPSTAVERALAAIWRESLGLAEVGLFDSFFDLGGHSLLLFKVRGLVKERLGRDLPALDFFRHPTLAALARSLDGPEDSQGSPAPDDRGAARRAGRGALDRQRSSRRSHRPTTDPADQEIPA